MQKLQRKRWSDRTANQHRRWRAGSFPGAQGGRHRLPGRQPLRGLCSERGQCSPDLCTSRALGSGVSPGNRRGRGTPQRPSMDCGGGLGPGRGRDGHSFASCPPPGVGGEHASPQRSRGPKTPGHCSVLAQSWGLWPAGQLPRPPWEGVLWQAPRTRLMPLRPGAWCSGSWRRGPPWPESRPPRCSQGSAGPRARPGAGVGSAPAWPRTVAAGCRAAAPGCGSPPTAGWSQPVCPGHPCPAWAEAAQRGGGAWAGLG